MLTDFDIRAEKSHHKRALSTESSEYFYRKLLEHGVLFGSRALNVITNPNRDYDIAIDNATFRHIIKETPDSNRLEFVLSDYSRNPYNYSNTTPEHGFASFFAKFPLRLNSIDLGNEQVEMDILVTKTEEDLDVIRSSVEDLKKVPEYFLKEKRLRIKLYEKALRHRGWEGRVRHPEDRFEGVRPTRRPTRRPHEGPTARDPYNTRESEVHHENSDGPARLTRRTEQFLRTRNEEIANRLQRQDARANNDWSLSL